MPALSPEDLAILAMPLHATRKLTIAVWKLVVTHTATVDVTPDWDEPVAVLAVTGTSTGWANIKRNTFFRIYRSGTLIFEGVTRRLGDPDVLYIPPIRKGDTGTAQEIAYSIEAGDTIEVYSASVPASFVSNAILNDEGEVVLYKMWDRELNEGHPQTQYPEPCPRFGSHRLVEVAPETEASLTFVDNSMDFKGDALETLWALPTEATITSGTTTSPSITIDLPPGQYRVQLQASRDPVVGNSDSGNGFRHVFVHDGPNGDYPAFSDLFFVEAIDRDEQNVDGRGVTLTISRTRGDTPDLLDYLYPGAFVILQETPAFTDDDWETVNTLSAGFVGQFVGYVRRYEQIATSKDAIETWRVYVESPLRFFDDLRIPSQSISANDPPTSWFEASSDLMRVDYWLYAIIYYHAQEIARTHDLFFEALSGFALPTVSWTQGSIGAALREIAKRVAGGAVGCLSDGALIATRDPVYENSTYRGTVAVVTTWEDSDIEDGLEYERDPLMKVGRTTGTSVLTSSSEVATYIEAEAGYLAPNQGPGSATLPGFIGLTQGDTRDRVGHHHTLLNRPTQGVTLELTGNQDVTEPARKEWHKLNVASYAPLNPEVFGTGRRWIPERVVRSWQFGRTGIEKRIAVSLRPETEGARSSLVPPPNIGAPFVPPTPSDSFCHLADFTVDDQGWVDTEGDVVYYAGSGWGPVDTSDTALRIFSAGSFDCTGGVVTEIRVTWNMPIPNAAGIRVYAHTPTVSLIGESEAGATSLNITSVALANLESIDIRTNLVSIAGDRSGFRILSARVRGSGTPNNVNEDC